MAVMVLCLETLTDL